MDARDPRISPAYADTANYPSDVLVVTGELDSSALEAEGLAARIRSDTRAGQRNVEIRRMKGCGHGFDKKKDKVDVEARDETYGLVVNMLKKVELERSTHD
jgi:acetyl esterase/lipase